jgi:hypothetical protein
MAPLRDNGAMTSSLRILTIAALAAVAWHELVLTKRSRRVARLSVVVR